MNKKHLKALCETVTARAAVLAILHNDASYASGKNYTHRPVSLEVFQGYNPSVTRATLQRLVDEGLIKAIGNGYVLYQHLNKRTLEWEIVHVGSVSL